MLQAEEMHSTTLQETQAIQNKTQDTLDKISETLDTLAQTVKGIRDLRATYRKFHGEFCEAISHRESAPHIPVNVLRSHKRVSFQGESNLVPKSTTFEDVVNELATKSHIVVLTGKGVASFDINLAIQEEALGKEIFTSVNFKENPEEVWKWHTELRKTLARKSANLSHQALADLQVFCRQSNIKFTMITQDVDGYYMDTMLETTKKNPTTETATTAVPSTTTTKTQNSKNIKVTNTKKMLIPRTILQAVDQTQRPGSAPTEPVSDPLENIYEINGNVRYMRCSNDNSDKPSECPEIDCSDVPRCPSCQHITRPHMLFLDEPNQEQKYYHEDIILQQVESMDCLLVVGASLDNGLVTRIVEKAAEKSLLMVEINQKPCIKYENVRQIMREPETVLPRLYEGTQKKVMEKKKAAIEEKQKQEKKQARGRIGGVSGTGRLRSQSKNVKKAGEASKWT